MPPRRKIELPPRLQVPRAPEPFVGREADAAWLATALEAGPLAVVAGMGGLGKTSLVAHVLETRFPAVRAAFVAVGPGALGARLWEGAAALADASGRIAEPPTSGSDEAFAGAAIDLLERIGGWLVVDDLHAADEGAAAELLALVVAHVRAGRVIVTTRVAPALAAVRALGPIADDGLATLLSALAPSAERHLVDEASGSPWRLRMLAGGMPAPSLVAASGPAADLLAALAHAAVPLSSGAVAILGGDAVTWLERRGFVEVRPGAVRLHDAARPDVEAFAASRTPDLAGWAARLLVSADSDVRLSALALLVAAGDARGAARLLDAQGEAWLASGEAAALWAILGKARDPALEDWRLRCALEARAPLAADEPSPTGTAPSTRLRWAAWLHDAGRVPESAEVMTAIWPHIPEALRDEAGFCAVRAYDLLGDHARNLALTDTWRPRSREAELRWTAYRAAACIALGRFDEARALVPSLTRPAIREARDRAVRVLMQLGELKAAEKVVAELARPGTVVNPSPHSLLMAAVVAFDAGRLAEARARVAELARRPGANRSLVLAGAALDVWCRFTAGQIDGENVDGENVDGLDADLGRVTDEARARRAHWPLIWLAVVEEWLALARAVRPGDELPADGRTETHLVVVLRHWRRVRFGLAAEPPRGPRFATPDLSVLEQLARAHAALVGKEPVSATEWVGQAVQTARAAGYRVFEAEAQLAAVEIAAARGDRRRLLDHTAALGRLATRLGSPRYADDAALARQLVARDPAELTRLALGRHSPAAARRAAALLGQEVALDAVDELVLRVRY